jgi:hypothetical protein
MVSFLPKHDCVGCYDGDCLINSSFYARLVINADQK